MCVINISLAFEAHIELRLKKKTSKAIASYGKLRLMTFWFEAYALRFILLEMIKTLVSQMVDFLS